MLVTPVIGARGRHFNGPASDAVTRRSDLRDLQTHEKKRRWITNSAGVYLLELAPVAG
ncbi:hypothetical protein NOCA2270031 [metagenome]|uniref:Uncharacterized protein n=1 Tax=metagenome TaxID=256318 RepID=A0A2P2C083_9ZZZZ